MIFYTPRQVQDQIKQLGITQDGIAAMKAAGINVTAEEIAAGGLSAEKHSSKIGIEAGGPGSGRHASMNDIRSSAYGSHYTDAKNKAEQLGKEADDFSARGRVLEQIPSGGWTVRPSRQLAAAGRHARAAVAHEEAAHLAIQSGNRLMAKTHEAKADRHWKASQDHFAKVPSDYQS